MKKLLNKKLIIPALLLVFVFVIVVLYRLGFRITYAPELENSWNAVSAVATWAGVIASFMAIWFAIRVPKQIAEQQNKIALFEKRYEFYKALVLCIRLSKILENIEKPVKYEQFNNHVLFLTEFNISFIVGTSYDETLSTSIQKVHEIIELLNEGSFLFEFEVEKYVDLISHDLLSLVTTEEIYISDDIIQKYIENIQIIKQDILPLIEKSLLLIEEK